MARLPFQQASVLPQQNRLSAPNVPNAPGVMPTQVPGQNIQAQAFQDLGKTISRIAFSTADIYLAQAEKAKNEEENMEIVDGVGFVDSLFNNFRVSLEKDPTDSAGALLRYKSFINDTQDTLDEYLKDKPKRVQNAVRKMLTNRDVQTKHFAQMQGVRTQQRAQISEVKSRILQKLEEQQIAEGPEFFLKALEQDETSFVERYSQQTQELIDSQIKNLPEGLQQEVRNQLYPASKNHILRAQQEYNNSARQRQQAGFVEERNNILRTSTTREEALDRFATLQSEMLLGGATDEPTAAKATADLENAFDNFDVTAQREQAFNSDNVAALEQLIVDLEQNEEAFPALSLPERRTAINKAKKSLIQLETKIAGQIRQSIEFDILAIGLVADDSPESLQLRNQASFEQKLAGLIDEKEKDAYSRLWTYAVEADDMTDGVETMTLAELEEIPDKLEPPVFIEGEQNILLKSYNAIYTQALKQRDAIKKRRAEDPASFYMIPEGQDPLASSTLRQVLDVQLQYVGQSIKQIPDRELRRRHMAGNLRLFSNQTLRDLNAAYISHETGQDRQNFMNRFESASGEFTALALSEAAMKKGIGIGLPGRAQLYTEVSEPGTVQNLFMSETNAKINRDNVEKNFGDDTSLNDVRTDLNANEDLQNFLGSLQVDPGGVALANDFEQAILDYALEMGRAGVDDPIEMAVEHMVNDNYIFLDVNGEVAPVRLRSEVATMYGPEDMGEALTDYTERWLAERKAGLVDVFAEDDQWAWITRGDETGIELVNLNPLAGNQISSRTSGVIMTNQELLRMTEEYVQAKGGPLTSDFGKDVIPAEVETAPLDPMVQAFAPGIEPGSTAIDNMTRATNVVPEPEEEPEPIERQAQDRAELLQDAESKDPAMQERQEIRRQLRRQREAPAVPEAPEAPETPADTTDMTRVPVGIDPTDDVVLEREIKKRFGAASRSIRDQVQQYIIQEDGIIAEGSIRFLEAQRDMHLDNASAYMRYNDTNKQDRGTYTSGALPLLAEELAMARVYQELITLHSR